MRARGVENIDGICVHCNLLFSSASRLPYLEHLGRGRIYEVDRNTCVIPGRANTDQTQVILGDVELSERIRYSGLYRLNLLVRLLICLEMGIEEWSVIYPAALWKDWEAMASKFYMRLMSPAEIARSSPIVQEIARIAAEQSETTGMYCLDHRRVSEIRNGIDDMLANGRIIEKCGISCDVREIISPRIRELCMNEQSLAA